VTAAQIAIACTGPRDGFVIAAMPSEDPYISSERLVVADVRRISPDGAAELWRAWLWPAAGGAMHVAQSCEAIDAATTVELLERLRKRAGKGGQWWGRDAA
jgi:hypothetical protein